MSRGEKVEGETGIYQKEDGRYTVLATGQNPDKGGELDKKEETLPPGSNLQDAREWRQDLREEIKTETTPRRTTRSVADYGEQWITRQARTKKPKTARTYAAAIEDRVLPAPVQTDRGPMLLGNVPIDEFCRSHVFQWRTWIESLRKGNGDPYAEATLAKWWRPFRTLIRELAHAQILPFDFSAGVDAPKSKRKGVRNKEALDLETMHAIVDAASEVAPQRHAEICTLVHTGMRTGELWALHWEDIHRDEGVIHVHRGISDGKLTDKTKTDSDRKPPLFEEVEAAIDGHLEWLMRSEHQGLTETDLVFPSNAGTPRGPGSLKKTLGTIGDRLGLDRKVNPQLIRKSVVTVLRNRGVPELAAQALTGHSDEAMQRYYFSANDETRKLMGVLERGGDRAAE